MSTYHSTIQITNSSNSVLSLMTSKSSGISSAFPATLSNTPGQNIYTFKQGFDFQIKFTAVYAAPNNASVSLQYYADGVQTFSGGIQPSPSNAFGGSQWSYTSAYDPVFVLEGEAVAPGN